MDCHIDSVARLLTSDVRPRRVAIIGAGWAGLAAAVQSVQLGSAVTLYDTTTHPGGRARVVERPLGRFDNGQHIMIGAYRETLRLLEVVGVDIRAAFLRAPLALVGPDGSGLKLPHGHPVASLLSAIARNRRWPMKARIGLLSWGAGKMASGFRCDPHSTVQDICRGLSPAIVEDLIEPLCVAAMNTRTAEASAVMFLRILQDSLFGAKGSSDLLIPRVDLSALFPEPASLWLERHGATLNYGTRVHSIERDLSDRSSKSLWNVDGLIFDQVILACTATEATRLTNKHAFEWAQIAASMRFEPIATAVMNCGSLRLPFPMVMLKNGPAQFAFDLGQLGGALGHISVVASAVSDLDHLNAADLGQVLADQAHRELSPQSGARPNLLSVLRDRRATWVATAGIARPSVEVAPGLCAAGDYTAGPYPSTLEGAVRSGISAAKAVHRNDNL